MENLVREERGHWIFAKYVSDEEIANGWDEKWKIIEHMSRSLDFMVPIADSRRIGSTQEYAAPISASLSVRELFTLKRYKTIDFSMLDNLYYTSNCFRYGFPWLINEFARNVYPGCKIQSVRPFNNTAMITPEGKLILPNHFIFNVRTDMRDITVSPIMFENMYYDEEYLNVKANIIQAKLVQTEVLKKEEKKIQAMETHISELEEKLENSVRLSKLKEILSEAEYEYIIGHDSE